MLSVRAREFTGSSLTPSLELQPAWDTGDWRPWRGCRCARLARGTNDRQGHEHIQYAGQEGDTSGHLPVRASRWRGSLIHGERLAWVIGDCSPEQ